MRGVDILRYFILCEFLVAAGFLLGIMARGPGRRNGVYLYGFGTSYLLLLGLGAAEVTLRLGQDASWRTFLAFTSGTVAVITMFWVHKIESDRNGKKHAYARKIYSRKA